MKGHNNSIENGKQNGQDHPPQVAVVMVPLPAQGHLNQLLHLSHLITSYGLPVHYAGSSIHNRQAKLRSHGWDPESLTKIHFHDFQLPPYPSLPPKPDPSVPFPEHLQPLFEASMHLRQPVFQLLQKLSTKFKRIIVIHDIIMAAVIQDIKFITNAESYTFVPVSAFTFFCSSWDKIPGKEKPFQLDSKDIPERIPSDEGCLTPEMLNFVVNQVQFLGFESGRLYNTSRLVEGRYVELLEKLSASTEIKHFALGPFNPVEVKRSEKHKHRCLEWLDKQERSSVIYVSFGSTTSMTDDQIEELAKGLETSGEKFIWVLRRADRNDVFAEGEVRRSELPEGFEERVKKRGMVVRDWAPQLEILAHPSTGGFMSHCGWNSCMESISMGVPMAAWPMHSDQPRNAVLVAKVLRIGTMVRDWTLRGELVSSRVIENAVKTLMASEEGEGMRKRAAELGKAVQGSVAKGGVAHLERDSFIAHTTRRCSFSKPNFPQP